jgi:signal transduction histidine kinase
VGAIVVGLAAVLLAIRTTSTSLAWIGRPFPGFMLLDNRVIASVGLASWSGSTVPDIYQHVVEAMDGRPVRSTAEAYEAVAALPVGTPVRWRLERDGVETDVVVPTQRFGARDWFQLFGPFLLSGFVYLASGLVVWLLRPGAVGRAFITLGGIFGVFLLTAMDLYGPATFFRLHASSEALLAPALFQLTALFPEPRRWSSWRFAGYLPALVLLATYQLHLHDPAVYSAVLQANMAYLGLAGIWLGAQLLLEYRRGRSELARQRVRVVTLATLLGVAVPGGLLVTSAVLGGRVPINLAAVTTALLPLSLAYAVVKHDLFELDAMVKRGAYYALLTGAVGAAYVAAVLLFNLTLSGSLTGSAAFPVLFTLAVLIVFNPLRTFLQGLVDRVFFRTRYDSAQVLESVGADLASALTREHIARLVRNGVDRAIPNARTRLFVGRMPEGLHEVGDDRGPALPEVLVPLLSPGRVLTVFDSAESYVRPGTVDAVRDALRELDAEVAVPLWLHGALVGVLTAGPKRSGLFYTAGDAAFLRALAHQAAIALQNAASYEELVVLNASLEERVEERTAALKASNTDLATALRELQQAQVQLVQSEKMASLGRLVAGVAHEINNPVSFIATSVSPLRRRLERAAAAPPGDVERLLGEAQEIVDIMARGAERTTSIVQDLRTFSRLGEATRKTVDLHDALDTTLRLLEARWRGQIVVHRDYGELPGVECNPGQMNQVFMNVLANAGDAVGERGNVWIVTRADGDDVEIVVRDDGIGMTPEVRAHVFDPFFTTKEVGYGTGLGLAISHQIVTAHGGRIDIDSHPGAGATVRIRIPLGQVRSLDTVAKAG